MAHLSVPERARHNYTSVYVYKDQTLGIGAFGKVCRAKCDDLICAAKILHETLYDPDLEYEVSARRVHRLPMRRFEQECEFLSSLKHPNVIQYLGMHQDPDTGAPMLLMELMDSSLTHYLDNAPSPTPFHIKVNFCQDIALALSYLHSKRIIHRDLSSNNVLLISNVRAKVTDFGMAQLTATDRQITFTLCPGTDVYMPPECVADNPVYTEKIDCFSFGVLGVQMLTHLFPRPGNRRETVEINHPRFPGGSVQVAVSEVERRRNHISQIDPNDPLLVICLDCLRDVAEERPSAHQLCNRLAALKQCSVYSESAAARVQERSSSVVARDEARVRSQREQEQRTRELQRTLESQSSQLKEKDDIITEKDRIIASEQLTNRRLRAENAEELRWLRHQMTEKDQLIKEKEDRIKDTAKQLKDNEEIMELFGKRIQELEQRLKQTHQPPVMGIQQLPYNTPPQPHVQHETTNLPLLPATATRAPQPRQGDAEIINLNWKHGVKAPCAMTRGCDAIVIDDAIYCQHIRLQKIYLFQMRTQTWLMVPNGPVRYCSIAYVNGWLTTIGGGNDTTVFGLTLKGGACTDKLYSLDNVGKWKELFPPMPTKRKGVASLNTGKHLIVVGGMGEKNVCLSVVEVMDTATCQWMTAAHLLEPRITPSMTVVGGNLYVVGGEANQGIETSSVYVCSIGALINSCSSKQPQTADSAFFTWNRISDLPVSMTTCVTLHGRLLAVGGRDAFNKATSAVYIYEPATNTWVITSYMPLARYLCVAAVSNDSQLLVVGGFNEAGIITDSVEVGSV